MVKFLIYFNQGGVAAVLAKNLRQMGHKVKLYDRYNRFGISEYYEIKVIPSYKKLVLNLFLNLLFYRPNIVHLNTWFEGIQLTNTFYKIFFFFKKPKIIFHGHGSEIRAIASDFNINDWVGKNKADHFIVCSIDIHLSGTTHLKNPIDTELFDPNKYKREFEAEKGKALYIRHPVADMTEKAKKYAREHNLDLTIYDLKQKPTPYHQMPQLLNQFEYYFDLKDFSSKEFLSCIGYQALHMGSKILLDTLEIMDPEKDKINHTKRFEKFLEIYEI